MNVCVHTHTLYFADLVVMMSTGRAFMKCDVGNKNSPGLLF
jgi:hypothetical protein